MLKTRAQIPMPEAFTKLLFVTQAHLGGAHTTKNMEQYVFGTRNDGVKVLDISKMWEKFVLAARAIASMKDTRSIIAISSKTFAPKAILRFVESVQCRSYTGRFLPGTFTNKIINNSSEPSLIVISDTMFDRQALLEAASVNCPTIALCNTDADLQYVDIAIPVNNRSPRAIGASFFILGRLVNYIKYGTSLDADIKDVELSFYRDAKELEKLCEEHNADKSVEYADSVMNQDEEDFGRMAQSEVLVRDNSWSD